MANANETVLVNSGAYAGPARLVQNGAEPVLVERGERVVMLCDRGGFTLCEVPNFCPGCGEATPDDARVWSLEDGDSLWTECDACGAHFGVAGESLDTSEVPSEDAFARRVRDGELAIIASYGRTPEECRREAERFARFLPTNEEAE